MRQTTSNQKIGQGKNKMTSETTVIFTKVESATRFDSHPFGIEIKNLDSSIESQFHWFTTHDERDDAYQTRTANEKGYVEPFSIRDMDDEEPELYGDNEFQDIESAICAAAVQVRVFEKDFQILNRYGNCCECLEFHQDEE